MGDALLPVLSSGDIYVLRLDKNGVLLWSATYGGPGIDAGYSVKQNNNGEFIIVGETYTSGTAGTDVFVMKLAQDDKGHD